MNWQHVAFSEMPTNNIKLLSLWVRATECNNYCEMDIWGQMNNGQPAELLEISLGLEKADNFILRWAAISGCLMIDWLWCLMASKTAEVGPGLVAWIQITEVLLFVWTSWELSFAGELWLLHVIRGHEEDHGPCINRSVKWQKGDLVHCLIISFFFPGEISRIDFL